MREAPRALGGRWRLKIKWFLTNKGAIFAVSLPCVRLRFALLELVLLR